MLVPQFSGASQLVGGLSIGTTAGPSVTLGAVVWSDELPGAAFGLTVVHVGVFGDAVFQPSPGDAAGGVPIGTIAASDAEGALIRLDAADTPVGRILGRPPLRGWVAEEALAELSPKLRAAVVLQYFHDCSRYDIAQILDIPSGTVASRIAKAIWANSRRLNMILSKPGKRRRNLSIALAGGKPPTRP